MGKASNRIEVAAAARGTASERGAKRWPLPAGLGADCQRHS